MDPDSSEAKLACLVATLAAWWNCSNYKNIDVLKAANLKVTDHTDCTPDTLHSLEGFESWLQLLQRGCDSHQMKMLNGLTSIIIKGPSSVTKFFTEQAKAHIRSNCYYVTAWQPHRLPRHALACCWGDCYWAFIGCNVRGTPGRQHLWAPLLLSYPSVWQHICRIKCRMLHIANQCCISDGMVCHRDFKSRHVLWSRSDRNTLRMRKSLSTNASSEEYRETTH